MILDSATVTSLTMMADRGGKRTNPLPLCNEEASVSALRMRGVNKSSGMGADSLIMYKPHFFFSCFNSLYHTRPNACRDMVLFIFRKNKHRRVKVIKVHIAHQRPRDEVLMNDLISFLTILNRNIRHASLLTVKNKVNKYFYFGKSL